MKKASVILYYLACALFLLYFILSSAVDAEKNRVYLKALFMVPFVLLIVSGYLKKDNKFRSCA